MTCKMPILICSSFEAVDNWIDRLRKSGRYNYFVRFLDVRGPALWYGYADWAERDCLAGYYVDW